jgi:hypothetical protein
VALDEGGEERLLRACAVAAAAVGACHLLALGYVFASRLSFPLDIDWIEGGGVYQAYRILHGQPVYLAGPTGFLPYPYPPLYYVAVAAAGAVTGGVSYAVARLVSVLAFAAVAASGALHVRAHARARGLMPSTATAAAVATAGLMAAGYPATTGAYDWARPDTLGAMFATFGVLALSRGVGSGPRAAPALAGAAGVALVLAVYTKQSHLLLAVALGAVLFWRRLFPRTQAAAYAATFATLAGGLLWGMQQATGGAFLPWMLDMRNHPFLPSQLAEGLASVLIGAPHLAIAFALAAHRRRATPRAWLWTAAAAATVLAAIVSHAKIHGAPNDYVAPMLLAAPAAMIAGVDLAAGAARREAVLLVALASLLAGKLYEGDRFRPTLEAQRRAGDLVHEVAGLDGDVLCPIYAFVPVEAGHSAEQAPLLSYLDGAEGAMPGIEPAAYVAYVGRRAPRWILVSGTDAEAVLQPLLDRDYRLARRLDGPDARAIDGMTSVPCLLYERKSAP